MPINSVFTFASTCKQACHIQCMNESAINLMIIFVLESTNTLKPYFFSISNMKLRLLGQRAEKILEVKVGGR